MKKLTDSYAIDETSGLLYVWTQGEFDAFAPPGTFPEWFWKATGYTFEFTKTWAASAIFWDNSPLQFATQLTAEKMLAAVKYAIPGVQASITVSSVRVGPLTRADQREITVDGRPNNAASLALTLVSNPTNWPQMFRDAVYPPKRDWE